MVSIILVLSCHAYLSYLYNYSSDRCLFFRYLRFARIATHSGSYYIYSQIWAEMKKSVSYRVDLSINHDGINEAQCECGAGQGPTAHCKHVGTTLYALQAFSSSGDLITETTCTQVGTTI